MRWGEKEQGAENGMRDGGVAGIFIILLLYIYLDIVAPCSVSELCTWSEAYSGVLNKGSELRLGRNPDDHGDSFVGGGEVRYDRWGKHPHDAKEGSVPFQNLESAENRLGEKPE